MRRRGAPCATTGPLGSRRVAGDAAPRVEARWIVLEASGASPEEWLELEAEPVTVLAAHRVDTMIERRLAGEPLQYVLGSWSFLGIDLMVDPRVLIPRPETEVVAQVAIDEVVRLGARVGKADPWSAGLTTYSVADLGTGSGALALALVTALPDAAVWATDASADALAVARAQRGQPGLSAQPASASLRATGSTRSRSNCAGSCASW